MYIPGMYESHYGFTEKPFNLTPDPKYLYLSRAAHRGLRPPGVRAPGAGRLHRSSRARWARARPPSPATSSPGSTRAPPPPSCSTPRSPAAELLRSILDDLHVPAAGTSLKDHVDALHRFLLQARAEGRDVVLLIDEAQDLSPEVLEQVRLISNLETDTEKLIQIVLMGQSELQEMLARRELRQLAQRVTARYHLAPLDEAGDRGLHPPPAGGGRRRRARSPSRAAPSPPCTGSRAASPGSST